MEPRNLFIILDSFQANLLHLWQPIIFWTIISLVMVFIETYNVVWNNLKEDTFRFRLLRAGEWQTAAMAGATILFCWFKALL